MKLLFLISALLKLRFYSNLQKCIAPKIATNRLNDLHIFLTLKLLYAIQT